MTTFQVVFKYEIDHSIGDFATHQFPLLFVSLSSKDIRQSIQVQPNYIPFMEDLSISTIETRIQNHWNKNLRKYYERTSFSTNSPYLYAYLLF